MKSVIDTIILFSMIAAIPSALFYNDYRKTERIRTSEIEEAVILEVSSVRKAILGYNMYRDIVLDINKNGKIDNSDVIVHTGISLSKENVGKSAIVAHHKYGVDLIAVDSDNGYIESYEILKSYGKYSDLLNEKFKAYISNER